MRWVVHFQSPLLLSEYVQEIGRAGRDGKPAHALTLISEPTGWLDPEDKQRQRYFEKNLRSLQVSAQQLMQKLPSTGEVNAVVQKFPEGAVALSLLRRSGQLKWLDPFHYTIVRGEKTIPHEHLDATKQMNRYLMTRGCRWQFLLKAFGFHEEFKNWRCGHCDRCH
ncbi:hypothetical protein NUACC21_31110 [Scytonema sp. NUACC21]